MQTKEYVGKYIKLVEYKTLPDSEFVRLTKELFWELVDEFKEVAEARHISTMYGIDNLTKEFNQKANRISELLGNPLKKDWFAVLFADVMNQIKRSGA